MLMSGGSTFTGVSGATYTSGSTQEIGTGDVRQAFLNNWIELTYSAPTPLFTPSTLTAAGIQAAIVAANAAGGGIVLLPAGTISLSASLVPMAGVYLQGVEPILNANVGIPDTNAATFTSGTILSPTGAFPAITWNTTALGTPASAAAFTQTGLFNIGFKNLGFLGGTYGIYGGGTNNASCWWSEFENLYFVDQTVIGLSLTNYQHCEFRRNYSFGCAWGQFHGIDVASTILQPGNSTYYDLYCAIQQGSATNMLSRGITFITTSATANGSNNQFKMDRIQSNRFNQATTTQAATMVNTSANITVTDGTKFAIGMPVAFSATANGFTTGTIYFVVALAANVLSVSSTYGGAAISATGTTAVNIINQGFPAFEMIGLAGSAMTNGIVRNLDVEAGGTCAVLFQNCTGFDVGLSQVPGTAQSTVSVCGRSFINSRLTAPQSCNTDMDGNSNGRAYQFFGARFGASAGYQGAGMWYDSVSGNTVLSLGSQFDTQSKGILTFTPGTNNLVAPYNLGIGQYNKIDGNAAPTLSNLCTVYSNTTSGTTITLPTLTAANLGMWQTFFNPTAAAQTINTNGVQTINNVTARTSITLNPNASVRLEGVGNTGGTFSYAIAGASSAMVSGVISAPT